ncbi:MAG TPA: 50S ribosomal protein L31 [Candidatus Nitrosotalea sp.]|nr:50S ribosomal protein L31 [Candidatus Nitrosotalea sp.]
MKEQIHPEYHESALVTCVCGNTFVTGSTRETMRTEVCSNCHPFYTGQQRIVDTGGQVERFMKRAAKSTR